MTTIDYRKESLRRRNALSAGERAKKSAAICSLVSRYEGFVRAETVLLFLSFGSEVDTRPLIEKAWHAKKNVLLPVCQPKHQMICLPFTPDTPLCDGWGGLKEICTDAAIKPLSPETIDFCLVPGAAFDCHGHRMGYGAGYYDRFLPKLSPRTVIGACAFEVQVWKEHELPQTKTDYPLPRLWTEDGCYEFTS